MKTHYKLLFILLVTCGLVKAQEVKSSQWTLLECVDYAIKNNINVKRASLNTLQNRASYDQSKAALLPSLNGRATHTYNFGQNVNPATNAIVNLDSRANTFGLNANITLFNGFANYNTIKQNNLLVDAALADYEQARNDIGLNIAQSYLQIIINKELLESSKAQLETSVEQVRRTKILVEAGGAPLADELQSLAQKALNEVQVINNENNLELSKLQLMQLMQLPYDPNFNIVNPQIEPDNLEVLTLDTQEIFEVALTNQPNVRATDLRIKASDAALSAAKGGRLPSLTAGVGVDTRYVNQDENFSFSEQLDNNLGQNIGFTMSIPLFNNLRVRQSIQNSSISKERAQLDDQETKNTLRQQVEQAYLNAKAALNTYNSNLRQVEALQLSFENMQKQREYGAVNITDYTVAQNNLTGAISDMIRAKYDYIFKLKILDFYQGKPLEF